MDWLKTLVLAIIQGLTEFLPVSSSAHLILPAQLLNWEDQGLAFDVAVHLGTLIAVLWYYRKMLIAMVQGAWEGVTQQRMNEDRKSTRLNSSHVAISYAVFGLKKKSERENIRLNQ